MYSLRNVSSISTRLHPLFPYNLPAVYNQPPPLQVLEPTSAVSNEPSIPPNQPEEDTEEADDLIRQTALHLGLSLQTWAMRINRVF